MGSHAQLGLTTILLLLISGGNLGLCLMFFTESAGEESSTELRKVSRRAKAALALAGASQILYLVFAALWLFRWMRFYPGRPAVLLQIFGGLALSFLGFVIALFGEGLKRGITIFSTGVTAFLWMLAAAASVAV